jgi:hypothetical protein
MRLNTIAVGVVALCLGSAAIAGDVNAFDAASFQAGFNAAFQSKDANAVGKFIAANYNEGGVSKQEFVRQLGDLFHRADVNVEYHITDFQQIPGTNYGSVKLAAKMSTRPVKQLSQNGHDAIPAAWNEAKVVRTAGYATVVYENAGWRLIAATTGDCSSDNADAATMQGTGWGSLINPAGFSAILIADSNKPVYQKTTDRHVFESPDGNLPALDATAWETKFRNAWNSKNIAQIMSFYSAHFTDLGMELPQIEQGFRKMLAQFDAIHCDYKVVGVRFLPGAPVASIKAELDLRGVKNGVEETILRTGGTASLVVENGTWKTFAVQPLRIGDIGEKAYQAALSTDAKTASAK